MKILNRFFESLRLLMSIPIIRKTHEFLVNLKFHLCSDCFKDEGLRIEAKKIGKLNQKPCLQCGSTNGAKLNRKLLDDLHFQFFITGSVITPLFGSAPALRYTWNNECDIVFDTHLDKDFLKINGVTKKGLTFNDPRLWKVGHTTPLLKLSDIATRNEVLHAIIKSFPVKTMGGNTKFYRLRENPIDPSNKEEYDSPPNKTSNFGRLDSPDLKVFYASELYETCIHEGRATLGPNFFLATLRPTKELRLLDLTSWIEENCDEYESLNIAVSFLFSSTSHSYQITQDLAMLVKNLGFDGIVFPSFFSDFHSGYSKALKQSWFPYLRSSQIRKYLGTLSYSNIALFGRPIEEHKIEVLNINRLILNKAEYDFTLGPLLK